LVRDVFDHFSDLNVSFHFDYYCNRGTLEQRAERLFSLKGLEKKDYPNKVRAKGFKE
jgi:hypothetical protein